MKKEDMLKSFSIPVSSPAVTRCRHRFNMREHMFITYETDRAALEKVVPEPMEIPDIPLVRFEVMAMPGATGFGDYFEAGQAIPVLFNGEKGEYLHMMYLDNFPATAAGREYAGYPKKIGYPSLYVDDETLVGTLDYGRSRIRVATATMNYKYRPLDHEAALAEICSPNYLLKLIPGLSGKPEIAQLNRSITTDCEIVEAWTGDARLELFQHVSCPMADLPVKDIVSCQHIITNLSLGMPETVYDYLK